MRKTCQCFLLFSVFTFTAIAQKQPSASKHTCSLSQLGYTAKSMGVDQQVSTGTYNGYHIGLSGCEGKPVGSYQIFLEPISVGTGSKAFCSDATQNVRVLEGGNGSNCLAFGKVQSSVEDDLTGFRVMTPTKEAEPK